MNITDFNKRGMAVYIQFCEFDAMRVIMPYVNIAEGLDSKAFLVTLISIKHYEHIHK